MTELEQQLLNAFKELQTNYENNLKEIEITQLELKAMFNRISNENQELKQQVNHLSELYKQRN